MAVQIVLRSHDGLLSGGVSICTLSDGFSPIDVTSLFDMDGTLVDSTAGVERAWHLFREAYPHIDVHDILSCAEPLSPYEANLIYKIASHGVRTVDNLKRHCGINDPAMLEVHPALVLFAKFSNGHRAKLSALNRLS